MSGGPPPYYGFNQGAYYPGAPPSNQYPGAPPTHFPSAPFPGAPPNQYAAYLPTHFHPAQQYPTSTTSSFYPNAGEAHFTSSFTPQSTTSFTPSSNTSFTPSSNTSFTPVSRWVQWQRGQMLPVNAVEAGFDVDGTKIYVGRLHYKGDSIPAKVIPQKNVAYVSYDGEEIASHSCEILCQERVSWVRCSYGSVPPGAIPVGRTIAGETLYAARVHHQGSLTLGKVHPSHRGCYIPFSGREVSFQEYEVLAS